PHPSYLRVKVWRRLARIGAVALKNSVYVLPRSDAALEDLQWMRREILESKGDATIVEAAFVSGVSDAEVEDLFRSARDADYDDVIKDARVLSNGTARSLKEAKRRELEVALVKLEERLHQIGLRDFFGASKRADALALLEKLRDRVNGATKPDARKRAISMHGQTWVTRVGVKVDRIASAWLILRFIDREAQLKFVPVKGYQPQPNELRFDMFDAEFSHEGEDCTFETLCRRFQLRRAGLRSLAEIIHDIDVKDAKFDRPETAGVAAMIDGLTRIHVSDEERIARGLELFDELLAHFSVEESAFKRSD
ncbi:MAG TPA: chromate resistance protein ChrB domain-containing protein, partial [Polyangiales bacterium]